VQICRGGWEKSKKGVGKKGKKAFFTRKSWAKKVKEQRSNGGARPKKKTQRGNSCHVNEKRDETTSGKERKKKKKLKGKGMIARERGGQRGKKIFTKGKDNTSHTGKRGLPGNGGKKEKGSKSRKEED